MFSRKLFSPSCTLFSRTMFSRTVFSRTVFSRTVFSRTMFSRTVFSCTMFSRTMFSRICFFSTVVCSHGYVFFGSMFFFEKLLYFSQNVGCCYVHYIDSNYFFCLSATHACLFRVALSFLFSFDLFVFRVILCQQVSFFFPSRNSVTH